LFCFSPLAWSQILGLEEEVLPSVETSTKLSDVKGVDKAKAELEEIVHYLKDPEVVFSAITICSLLHAFLTHLAKLLFSLVANIYFCTRF